MKSHWFLPETPDVLGTLGRQADVTVTGIAAFAEWAHGDVAAEGRVRAAEHDADRVRRQLQVQLRQAFSTPIDQEDLYTLSELLDSVMNAAKNIVRESDVLALSPDAPIAAMAEELVSGVGHVRAALQHLNVDPDLATKQADMAIASERKMEKIYREAMRQLLEVSDLRLAISRRELYRRVLEAGERLAAVSERIWYSVVKEV